jgi:hypothetical protein
LEAVSAATGAAIRNTIDFETLILFILLFSIFVLIHLKMLRGIGFISLIKVKISPNDNAYNKNQQHFT